MPMSTVLLDFIGTPGSGKSTVSHEIADILRSQGHSVCEPTYDSEHVQSSKVRIIKKLFATVCCTLSIKKSPYKILCSIDNSCFKTRKEKLKQYINLCHIISCISKCNKNNFVIADQGVAQAAVSLCNHCNEEQIPIDIVKRIAEKIGITPYVIYVTTGNTERNLTYLLERSGGASRVDKIDSTNGKVAALEEIQKVINVILRQCNNYLTFVTDKPLNSEEHQCEIVKIVNNITALR